MTAPVPTQPCLDTWCQRSGRELPIEAGPKWITWSLVVVYMVTRHVKQSHDSGGRSLVCWCVTLRSLLLGCCHQHCHANALAKPGGEGASPPRESEGAEDVSQDGIRQLHRHPIYIHIRIRTLHPVEGLEPHTQSHAVHT